MTERSVDARLDAYLALERLTLAPVSEAAGWSIDWSSYRAGLLESIQTGVVIDQWQGDTVTALATLKPITESHWFVSMLILHPEHRGPKRLSGFLGEIQQVLQAKGIDQLSSHVLKQNHASIALHNKLGFQAAQENDLAIAYELKLESAHFARLLRTGTLNPTG
ncbi:GNAT family N-acetyltransferase [Saccharospirillum mangrovi]|uniref:GNAT family N-acetyltransferase n=1 Tax=Saccharospirillum mangrovi TaxID=2161747 RepID=UPI000D36314C|nr:GNAT family N-acetyltransferase [Saccharospirillum mangrovi]